MVPVYCITLDPKGKRAERTVEEFRPYGITPTLFRGFNAAKWGARTSIKMKDHLGEPYYIGPTQIGCIISHWMLWNHLLTAKVTEALVVEDDVKLCVNFLAEFERSYCGLPLDWQWAFVGHCCASDKPAAQVSERVWDIRWPMCTHCYLANLSCFEAILEPMAELRVPIDITLIENVFARGLVKAYAFQPGLAIQYDTYLSP